MEVTLRELVETASDRAEVRDAVAALYARVAATIEIRRPHCDISGRCCRFDEYGHRLYVTTLELAHFVHALGAGIASRTRPFDEWDGSGCPFQRKKLCGVHAIRPFGCRMFFCDVTAALWQNETYERFHSELKQLHDQLGVPYRYVEWRTALREMGLADEVLRPTDLL